MAILIYEGAVRSCNASTSRNLTSCFLPLTSCFLAVRSCDASTSRKLAWPFRPREGQRRRIGRIYTLILIVAMCALTIGAVAPGQALSPSEYQVKAFFLYNFVKFVEWPAEAFPSTEAPIIIGIVGEDPFGGVLDETIKSKTINGRPLTIKRLKKGQDLGSCHILFISLSEKGRLGQILENLKGSSVLTVSEIERFAHLGGTIHLFIEENKVRFEINADIAERARLKISSKLLALAKVVRDGHRIGGS